MSKTFKLLSICILTYVIFLSWYGLAQAASVEVGCCYYMKSDGTGVAECGTKTECDAKLKGNQMRIYYPTSKPGTGSLGTADCVADADNTGCPDRESADATGGQVVNKKSTAPWNITGLTNPVRTIKPAVVIGRVVRAILLIIGSIALLMFIYGGVTWMTASGNDAKITKAKNTLVWATLGLVVVFAAYLLVKYVLEALGII